jgi:endonuclease YncB( thermonuclease family)
MSTSTVKFFYAFVVIPWILFIGESCNLSTVQPSAIISSGDSVKGKVVSVVDGDTYHLLLHGNQNVKVRMYAIDAPEKTMPYFQASKQYLSSLIYFKDVTLVPTGKDRNGRWLGYTYLPDGQEISHEMVKAGMAWHFKRYNQDDDLAQLENQARDLKLGLWADNYPVPPWEFRKEKRTK